MVENINEEKLQEILQNIIMPGSSIGVHVIDKGQFFEVANSILAIGLKNSKHHEGLTGTIAFLGQKETFDYNDILDYFYGNYDSNGNIFTIVCAIPETIKTTDDKEYYLGAYEKFNGYGKDDYKAHSMPTHDPNILPPEFIVGCVVRNVHTRQSNFIINKNYVSFKNDEQQFLVNDNLLQKIQEYKNLMWVYTLDEEGYENAQLWMEVQPKVDSDSNHYANLFLNKYENLTKGERGL